LSAVNVSSVVKSYGDRRALNNVSFSVADGEILGLLGPNGSGKSTLMKIIVGVLKPDSGTVQVLGNDSAHDSIAVKRLVGFVPESPRLYEFLTGTEYLDFIADIHGLSAPEKAQRIPDFVKAFDLEGRENELINGYSQGMKQKMAIIAGLLHKPRVLVLDEPLNGLDPRSARIVKDLVHKLKNEGICSIFSTHVLEIAEAICDRIVILREGQVLTQGPAEELKKQAGEPGSSLEEVFLKLTGTADTKEIVEALTR